MAMEFAKTKRLIDPASDTDYLSIPGGIAVYGGSHSPFNRVIGFGVAGTPVESYARAQAFYWPKLSTFEVELYPWADPEAHQLLLAKKFQSSGTRELWARSLSDEVIQLDPNASDRVLPAPPNQHKLWAMHLTQAFDIHVEWDLIDTFLTYGQMPSVYKFLALDNGLVAGGAAMYLRDQTALLFGAAVKADLRDQGLHRALIELRLQEAQRLGANLAIAETLGGTSSHNLLALGFTKVAELPQYKRPN